MGIARPWRRSEDNIRIDLKLNFGNVDWILLDWTTDQYRDFVSTGMNFRVPGKLRNFVNSASLLSLMTMIARLMMTICCSIKFYNLASRPEISVKS